MDKDAALTASQGNQPSDTSCPSCGRFVGPLNRCPHCGTRITKRMTIRFFRGMALLIGFAGLGLLYLMATRGEIPIIKIDDIDRTMNFAFVRVSGMVMGDARTFREAGQIASVAFTVNDGSEEELIVRAYRGKARELIEADLTPRSGDRVIVGGSLQVTADDMAMWLADTALLQIDRADISRLDLNDLTMDLEGRNVIVEGVITDVITPKMGTRAPWMIRFTDGLGDGRLNFWDDVYQDIQDKMGLEPQIVFRAQATVVYQQERLQFQLNRAADLTFPEMDADTFMSERSRDVQKTIKPVDVKPHLLGQLVVVEGAVERVQIPPPGSRAYHRIDIKSGRTTIEVVYQDVSARNLPADALVAGEHVRVFGVVEQTAQGLRLRVYHPSQLQKSGI